MCIRDRVIHVPNFVQICAIVNELWAIDEIQNGGRRHLDFFIFVHFGQMVYFRWQPSTSLQNFIRLRQSTTELMMFVQKSKMATAAILNYNFVMMDHPQSLFVHLKFHFKFRVDRVCTFRDIAIRRFHKFGLKCLFRPQKSCFWWVLTQKSRRRLLHKPSYSQFCPKFHCHGNGGGSEENAIASIRWSIFETPYSRKISPKSHTQAEL